MFTAFYSPFPVLVSLPLDFGQHVIQSPQFWGDSVNLDTDSVRVRPRHAGPVQGLKSLPLPPDMGETPDGARQSRFRTVRLHGNFPGVKVTVLRFLQSLLKLALQQLVSPLQLVDFGQEAAESQVERFQHMDVGAQGAGHRARPGGGVAGRPRQSIGKKQRVHVGQHQEPVILLRFCLVSDATRKSISFYLHILHSHRTSFSLKCRCWEGLNDHSCPCWMFTPEMLTTWTPAPHSKNKTNKPRKSFKGVHYLPWEVWRRPQQSAAALPVSLIAVSVSCKELLMLCGLHIARGGKMVHLPSCHSPLLWLYLVSMWCAGMVAGCGTAGPGLSVVCADHVAKC